MLPKDEKAEHLRFQVGFFCRGEGFLGVWGWLDHGCDLERLPDLTWHLFLGTVLGSVSGHCLIACLSWGVAGGGFERWKGWEENRQGTGVRRWGMKGMKCKAIQSLYLAFSR